MSKKNEVKDRIISIIEYYGLTANRFSESIEMSRAYVKNIRDEISTRALRNILRNYPEVNICWLISGEGEMILGKEEKEESGADNIKDRIILDQARQITELRMEVEKLRKPSPYEHERANITAAEHELK